MRVLIYLFSAGVFVSVGVVAHADDVRHEAASQPVREVLTTLQSDGSTVRVALCYSGPAVGLYGDGGRPSDCETDFLLQRTAKGDTRPSVESHWVTVMKAEDIATIGFMSSPYYAYPVGACCTDKRFDLLVTTWSMGLYCITVEKSPDVGEKFDINEMITRKVGSMMDGSPDGGYKYQISYDPSKKARSAAICRGNDRREFAFVGGKWIELSASRPTSRPH